MKKLTFLFIATFIIALVFFSSYLVVQEVRGVNITELNMGTHKITDLPNPAGDSDAVNKGYLNALPILYFTDNSIDSWCDVQFFTWCSGGDDYPEPQECDFDGICDPGEDEYNCPSDCGCNNNEICEGGRGETKFNCEDCEIIH